MIYPPEVDQIVERICAMKGVVYLTNDLKVFCCRPTDKALKCLFHKDMNGALMNDVWGGKNLWVIQWYGSKGAREALRYLAQFVGEGGCMAGERHGRIKIWSKSWLDRR